MQIKEKWSILEYRIFSLGFWSSKVDLEQIQLQVRTKTRCGRQKSPGGPSGFPDPHLHIQRVWRSEMFSSAGLEEASPRVLWLQGNGFWHYHISLKAWASQEIAALEMRWLWPWKTLSRGPISAMLRLQTHGNCEIIRWWFQADTFTLIM